MEDKIIKVDGRKTRTEFHRKYEIYDKTWDFKQTFLDDAKKLIETNAFNEHRYTIMKNLLRKVARWERRYNKDVYDFDPSQLKGMLKEFNSNSEQSLMSQKSNLEYYLWYAKEIKHMGNSNVPYTINLSIEEIRDFVNPIGSEARFISRNEIYNLVIDNLVNYVDQAIILLIFEGIMGKANQDLMNLEWRNIDFSESIIKINDKEIVIPTELAEILDLANNQQIYLLNNGLTEEENKKKIADGAELKELIKRTKVEIVDKYDSPYLLRPNKQKDGDIQLSGASIQRRVLTACKMHMDRPYLTLSSIYLSGLADRGVRHSMTQFDGEMMRNVDWQNFLKQSDEHVNLQDSYKLYKDFYARFVQEQKELEQQED